LQFSRRKFLRSLSRSALVLSLENVLSLARPIRLQAVSNVSEKDEKPELDLGVSFVNVGSEAGLNVETIFGGEHKNKYLLETTGCGVAFYDYDNDGWLDIFW
jgi:enediyne biosynthesis protein E4